MIIEIEIPDPGKDYQKPERRPIYTSMFDHVIILIGEDWCRASDMLKLGGDVHIMAARKAKPEGET